MFYTVNDENGMIIDGASSMPDPQEQADFFKCPVYIIRGEIVTSSVFPTEEVSNPDA